MANRNYQQGYRYEVLEVAYWISRGYYAERAYASKGRWDVFAANSKEVVLVAVTSFSNRRSAKKARDDTKKLRAIPKSPGLRRLQVEYGPIKKGKTTPRKEVEV